MIYFVAFDFSLSFCLMKFMFHIMYLETSYNRRVHIIQQEFQKHILAVMNRMILLILVRLLGITENVSAR